MSRAFGVPGSVWDEIRQFLYISGANTCENEMLGTVEKERFGSQGEADWSVELQPLMLHLAMSQQFGLDSNISLFKRSCPVLETASLLRLLAPSSPH